MVRDNLNLDMKIFFSTAKNIHFLLSAYFFFSMELYKINVIKCVDFSFQSFFIFTYIFNKKNDVGTLYSLEKILSVEQ